MSLPRSRMTLNLRDRNYPNGRYSSAFGICDLLEWDRECLQPGPIVFTDAYLNDQLLETATRKIAWLLEPIEIDPSIYAWIEQNYVIFEHVFTHDDDILKIATNSQWVPVGGTWIPTRDRQIYQKSQICSFVASSKDSTVGQKLRQVVRQKLPFSIDKYGKGFSYREQKVDCLREYCFSIAIENCMRDTYFTEKLIDCFNTGTVPIYWGTRKVSKFFNENGIVFFQSAEELIEIVKGLSEDGYRAKLDAINDNFLRARDFETSEGWIVNILDK
jgi:hypothetical protein